MRADRVLQPAQGRQALHHRHHRRQLQLRPQPGLHHRRGQAGRHLRAAHQRRAPATWTAREVVSSYKALAQVERAFRAFNTDLDIRPIRHRTEDRVRAHVFLRMMSYYITWHMQARLAPVLFTDDDKPAAQAARTSPVAPAARSPKALAKAATKHTPADLPGAQLRQPAHRPGHHLPEHHRTRRPRPARLPARHHPDRRSSARPSTCSASATASASRSQQPAPAHHESPGKRPNARIAGGNFGLEIDRFTT